MDSQLLNKAVLYHGPELLRHMQIEQQPVPGSAIDCIQKYRMKDLQDIPNVEFQQKVKNFMAKKADFLFRTLESDLRFSNNLDDEDSYAKMPPLESFMGVEPSVCRNHFYNSLEKRDIIVGVVSSVSESGLVLMLLCMDNGKSRDIDDFRISAFCPVKELPRQFMHQNPIENFQVKDKVRGVVLSVNPENERIIVSLLERSLPEDVNIKLGLVNEDEFPVHYRRKLHIRGLTFDELIHSILGFNNAGNMKCLLEVLNQPEEASLMRGLHNAQIPEKEMCESLRKQQSEKWAHGSVAQGIALFKSGNVMEAMQFLNRALQIDTTNVEALVARGALYANNESYIKAIEDFEAALAINPQHKNAVKYMIETLLAQGRIHEDQGRYDESEAYYKQALSVDPESMEAREALRYMYYKKARDESERKPGAKFRGPLFEEERSLSVEEERPAERSSMSLKNLIATEEKPDPRDFQKRKRYSKSDMNPEREIKQRKHSPGYGSDDIAQSHTHRDDFNWNRPAPHDGRPPYRDGKEQYPDGNSPSQEFNIGVHSSFFGSGGSASFVLPGLDLDPMDTFKSERKQEPTAFARDYQEDTEYSELYGYDEDKNRDSYLKHEREQFYEKESKSDKRSRDEYSRHEIKREYFSPPRVDERKEFLLKEFFEDRSLKKDKEPKIQIPKRERSRSFNSDSGDEFTRKGSDKYSDKEKFMEYVVKDVKENKDRSSSRRDSKEKYLKEREMEKDFVSRSPKNRRKEISESPVARRKRSKSPSESRKRKSRSPSRRKRKSRSRSYSKSRSRSRSPGNQKVRPKSPSNKGKQKSSSSKKRNRSPSKSPTRSKERSSKPLKDRSPGRSKDKSNRNKRKSRSPLDKKRSRSRSPKDARKKSDRKDERKEKSKNKSRKDELPKQDMNKDSRKIDSGKHKESADLVKEKKKESSGLEKEKQKDRKADEYSEKSKEKMETNSKSMEKLKFTIKNTGNQPKAGLVQKGNVTSVFEPVETKRKSRFSDFDRKPSRSPSLKAENKGEKSDQNSALISQVRSKWDSPSDESYYKDITIHSPRRNFSRSPVRDSNRSGSDRKDANKVKRGESRDRNKSVNAERRDNKESHVSSQKTSSAIELKKDKKTDLKKYQRSLSPRHAEKIMSKSQDPLKKKGDSTKINIQDIENAFKDTVKSGTRSPFSQLEQKVKSREAVAKSREAVAKVKTPSPFSQLEDEIFGGEEPSFGQDKAMDDDIWDDVLSVNDEKKNMDDVGLNADGTNLEQRIKMHFKESENREPVPAQRHDDMKYKEEKRNRSDMSPKMRREERGGSREFEGIRVHIRNDKYLSPNRRDISQSDDKDIPVSIFHVATKPQFIRNRSPPPQELVSLRVNETEFADSDLPNLEKGPEKPKITSTPERKERSKNKTKSSKSDSKLQKSETKSHRRGHSPDKKRRSHSWSSNSRSRSRSMDRKGQSRHRDRGSRSRSRDRHRGSRSRSRDRHRRSRSRDRRNSAGGFRNFRGGRGNRGFRGGFRGRGNRRGRGGFFDKQMNSDPRNNNPGKSGKGMAEWVTSSGIVIRDFKAGENSNQKLDPDEKADNPTDSQPGNLPKGPLRNIFRSPLMRSRSRSWSRERQPLSGNRRRSSGGGRFDRWDRSPGSSSESSGGASPGNANLNSSNPFDEDIGVRGQEGGNSRESIPVNIQSKENKETLIMLESFLQQLKEKKRQDEPEKKTKKK